MANGDNSIQYFDWVEYPHARVRVEIEKQGGVPTRFVIQIERRVDDGWHQVVRFDHDPSGRIKGGAFIMTRAFPVACIAWRLLST